MCDWQQHQENQEHMQQVIEVLDRITNREDRAFLARECGLGFYATELEQNRRTYESHGHDSKQVSEKRRC